MNDRSVRIAAGDGLCGLHGGFIRNFIGRFESSVLRFTHFTNPLSTVNFCPLTTTGPM